VPTDLISLNCHDDPEDRCPYCACVVDEGLKLSESTVTRAGRLTMSGDIFGGHSRRVGETCVLWAHGWCGDAGDELLGPSEVLCSTCHG
jgi:hypothetical protein